MRSLLNIDADLRSQLDQTALLYDDGVHVKHRLTRYHDFFVERVNESDQVLDIGCGYGTVAFSVASRTGAQVTGIDFSIENIRLANDRYQLPNLRFVVGDALTDLPNEDFDVVIFSNVLEHIERRPEFLRAAQTRIRPSRWLIRVPMIDRDWRVPLRRELGLYYFSDPTHFTEYTEESFRQEIAEAGLEVRELKVNWGEIWAEIAVPI